MVDKKTRFPPSRKLLVITYYWPPAGGPGVQRWLKFVKYLPEFGVEPIVYIPENPTYPILDKSLLSEVPKDLKIIKQPIFEPYRYANSVSKKDTETLSSGLIAEEKKQSFLQKILLYIRGNFFIPDARKYWVEPSVRFLQDYLSKEKIDTIITTGPPHSLHLIGLKLKENLNLKWIADFRDPWTNIGYHEKLKLTKSSEKKHREMESKVLKTADQIIVTSFSTKEEFLQKTDRSIAVITNGFDEEKEVSVVPDEKFTLSHIGSLLSGRNPLNLWKALSELVAENPDFKSAFRLQLIGKVSETVLDSISKSGLESHLDLIGYVPHEEAIKYQHKSQVLLLLEIDDPKTKGIIPGKLFEYLQAKRPILAIGPKAWDVCKILDETSSGSCFVYPEKQKIKEKLLKFFQEYQTGNLQTSPNNNEKYHRRNLTGELAKLI
jgi:hypothetical protein